MRWREFITLLGGATAVLLFVGRAQQGSTTMSEAFARVVQKVERMIVAAPILLSIVFVLLRFVYCSITITTLPGKKGSAIPAQSV